MHTPRKRHYLSLFTLFITALTPHAVQAKDDVEITTRISHPYLEPGTEQTVYFKIGLKGKKPHANKERPAINVALILDKSGSMSGQKIADAKKASKMLVDRLNPNDIVSVIAYDNQPHVIVRAQPVRHPEMIKAQINQIQANGGTALYHGVETGARELQKFFTDNQVSRAILLSDGIANVGPSTPTDLAELGHRLANQGISVSTIGLGLGYNEDLMARLANSSDGTHQFAESADDLAQAFDWQFGKMASVVANGTEVTINFADNVTPIRVLGREGNVSTHSAYFNLNEIFSTHETYALVEAKVKTPTTAHQQLTLAHTIISYRDLEAMGVVQHSRAIYADISFDKNLLRNTRDTDVIIAATEQISALKHEEIIKLRDEGKTAEAKTQLEELSKTVNQAGEDLNSGKLNRYGEILKQQLNDIENNQDWNKTRKQGTATLQSVTFGTI